MAVPQLTRWGWLEPNSTTARQAWSSLFVLVLWNETQKFLEWIRGILVGCLLVRERNCASNSISGSKWAFLVSAHWNINSSETRKWLSSKVIGAFWHPKVWRISPQKQLTDLILYWRHTSKVRITINIFMYTTTHICWSCTTVYFRLLISDHYILSRVINL